MCPAILSCLCDGSGWLISHCFGVHIFPWGSQSAYFVSAAGWGTATHLLFAEVSQVLCFGETAHPVHEVECVSPSLLSWFVPFISPCILILISKY